MIRTLLLILLIFSLLSGCVYFNTFYLAQKNFKNAEIQRIRDNGAISADTKKKYTDAINWSSEVYRNYSDSRYVDDSLYIIGMSNYYLKDYFRARTTFSGLITTFPESKVAQDARYYMARSLMGLGQYDEARMILNELATTGSREFKGRAGITLAEITYENEEWNELLVAAQTVIDANPEKSELDQAIFYKGKALFELERFEECISTLESLSRDGLQPELLFRINSLIAQSKAKLGVYKDALGIMSSMENKGEFVPFEPKIRLEIGKIYELQENFDIAIETYRKMAGDFPDSLEAKEAWYRVGTLLMTDLSKAREAKDAFDMVEKGRAKTTEPWFVDAKIKSVQIDSMTVRIKRIEELEDNPETRARARFSLAELYMYSFNRPDSALTQYRRIVEETPNSDYAVMSDFFMRRNELIKSNRLTEETEKEMVREIIEQYPDNEYTQKLKVYAGIIDTPPYVIALEKAEIAKFSGQSSSIYIPLYKAVIDSFPTTKSAYQARLVLAYSYEHDVGDMDKALELYKELASETPTVNSSEYVDKAKEKLDYYQQEPRMIEEIQRYLAGYTGIKREDIPHEETLTQPGTTDSTESGYTGYKKIRARNARIHSRYFTD